MTFVVTENCEKCRFTDCVTVCPVDCFYGDSNMLYINPEECIDCGACASECPVEAIYDNSDIPDELEHWIKINEERAENLPNINEKEEPLDTADGRRVELGFN